MKTFTGRVIREGNAEGSALVSSEPVSFYGGVDLDTGVVVERDHPLHGEALAGRVLVIPRGKGSTVGSWAILRLARRGLAHTTAAGATPPIGVPFTVNASTIRSPVKAQVRRASSASQRPSRVSAGSHAPSRPKPYAPGTAA